MASRAFCLQANVIYCNECDEVEVLREKVAYSGAHASNNQCKFMVRET